MRPIRPIRPPTHVLAHRRLLTRLQRLSKDAKGAPSPDRRGVPSQYQARIDALEDAQRQAQRDNDVLRRKLELAKTQQPAAARKGTGRVPARTERTVGLQVAGASPGAARRQQAGQERLHRAEAQMGNLREANEALLRQVDELELQLEEKSVHLTSLTQRLQAREAEASDARAESKRANIDANVGVIRLKRDLGDKAARVTALQAKYEVAEAELHRMKAAHRRLVDEMKAQADELAQERSQARASNTRGGAVASARETSLQVALEEAVAERDLLRQTNEQLIASAFDSEREAHHEERQALLREKIEQLQAAQKADLVEKTTLMRQLAEESEEHARLQEERRELHRSYLTVRAEHERLAEKLKFFTRESGVDFSEIEEALVLVRERKESRRTGEPGFLLPHHGDAASPADGGDAAAVVASLEQQLRSLQATHAETQLELDKTRKLLRLEHNMRTDLAGRAEERDAKLLAAESSHSAKLEEYARLADLRALRIKKLEAQIRDIAYGTHQYKIKADADASRTWQGADTSTSLDETLDMQKGQNAVEIHISRVTFSEAALAAFGADVEPVTFLTYDFFEHETQSSSVVGGKAPEFDSTSQYVVNVNDVFLQYLLRGRMTIELHQTLGADYRTWAACHVRFTSLLLDDAAAAGKKILGSAQLVSLDDSAPFAVVHYWVRFRLPMEQAFRLYKERLKAQGYDRSNELEEEHARMLREPAEDPAAAAAGAVSNTLYVEVVRGSGLRPRLPESQPSTYVAYQFYNSPDHTTGTVTASNSPEFNSKQGYPVVMDAALDEYLRARPLVLFVIDDEEHEDAGCLGMVRVPLAELAMDKAIHGRFPVVAEDGGGVVGQLSLWLHWQHPYEVRGPPPASAAQPATMSGGASVAHAPAGPAAGPPDAATLDDKATVAVRSPPRHASAAPPASQTGLMEEDIASPEQGARAGALVPPPRRVTVVQSVPDNATDAAEPTGPSSQQTPAVDELGTGLGSLMPTGTLESASSTFGASASGDVGDEGALVVSLEGRPRKKRSPNKPKRSAKNAPPMAITIHHLELSGDSAVARDPDVTHLFVSYDLFGVDSRRLETPISLPKPAPSTQALFECRRVFRFDGSGDDGEGIVATPGLDKALRVMAKDIKSKGTMAVNFVVVSEPAPDSKRSLPSPVPRAPRRRRCIGSQQPPETPEMPGDGFLPAALPPWIPARCLPVSPDVVPCTARVLLR